MQGEYVLKLDDFRPALGMTLREYAAIHLQVPDSGQPELDRMIEQSLCQDFEQMDGQCPVFGLGKCGEQTMTTAEANAYLQAQAGKQRQGKRPRKRINPEGGEL